MIKTCFSISKLDWWPGQSCALKFACDTAVYSLPLWWTPQPSPCCRTGRKTAKSRGCLHAECLERNSDRLFYLQVTTDWVGLIDEWAGRFFAELDYEAEARNAATFKQQMAQARAEPSFT